MLPTASQYCPARCTVDSAIFKCYYRSAVSGTGVGTFGHWCGHVENKNVDCGKSFSDLGCFNILIYGAYVTIPWPVYGLVPSSWREEVVGA